MAAVAQKLELHGVAGAFGDAPGLVFRRQVFSALLPGRVQKPALGRGRNHLAVALRQNLSCPVEPGGALLGGRGVQRNIAGLIVALHGQRAVGFGRIPVVLDRGRRLEVQRGEIDTVFPQIVGQSFRRQPGLGCGVTRAQRPGVADHQHDAATVVLPTELVHALLDAGKGVLVHVVGRDRGLLHLGQRMLQPGPVLHCGEIADDFGGIANVRRALHVAAEGHHGKGHLVAVGAFLQLVVEMANELQALVDIGLHGDGGVNDKGNAGAQLGRSRRGLPVRNGCPIAALAAARIDGCHLHQVQTLIAAVNVQNRHKVEVFLGNRAVRRLAGDNREVRRLLFLLYGSRVLPDRIGYIVGLTGLFQRFAVAEEVDRGTAHAVGKEHGDGLRPFGDHAGVHPAVRARAACAHLKAFALPAGMKQRF